MAGNNHDRAENRPANEGICFDAVLHPHRSLTGAGFFWVMAALGVPLLALGIGFWWIGAWPVFGFCGLEFMLLYAAFRINFRAGHAHERVRLGRSGLEVRRIDARGREREVWRVQPNWLRISVADEPDSQGRLTLASHGREIEIGGFLTPEERHDLARALRHAVDAWRTAPPPCAPAMP